jgi:hypothetical protein
MNMDSANNFVGGDRGNGVDIGVDNLNIPGGTL